eukprot:8691124-Ditylum_brightwellii.AAC.1
MHIARDPEPASSWQHQHTLAAMWMCWQPEVRLNILCPLILDFFQPIFLLFWGGISTTCPLLSFWVSFNLWGGISATCPLLSFWVSFNLWGFSWGGISASCPLFFVVAQCPPLENRWGPCL